MDIRIIIFRLSGNFLSHKRRQRKLRIRLRNFYFSNNHTIERTMKHVDFPTESPKRNYISRLFNHQSTSCREHCVSISDRHLIFKLIAHATSVAGLDRQESPVTRNAHTHHSISVARQIALPHIHDRRCRPLKRLVHHKEFTFYFKCHN